MQHPIDWEQVMERTKRSAMAASQNSENAMAGMVKLLETMDRHSKNLVRLKDTIQNREAIQDQQIEQIKEMLSRAQSDSLRFCRQSAMSDARHSFWLRALGCFVAFAVVVAFAGFIMS